MVTSKIFEPIDEEIAISPWPWIHGKITEPTPVLIIETTPPAGILILENAVPPYPACALASCRMVLLKLRMGHHSQGASSFPGRAVQVTSEIMAWLINQFSHYRKGHHLFDSQPGVICALRMNDGPVGLDCMTAGEKILYGSSSLHNNMQLVAVPVSIVLHVRDIWQRAADWVEQSILSFWQIWTPQPWTDETSEILPGQPNLTSGIPVASEMCLSHYELFSKTFEIWLTQRHFHKELGV